MNAQFAELKLAVAMMKDARQIADRIAFEPSWQAGEPRGLRLSGIPAVIMPMLADGVDTAEEIAEIAKLTHTSVSIALRRLERRGLVERTGKNGRWVTWKLTEGEQ